MCGIVGVMRQNGVVDQTLFDHMRDSFTYRGPDDADSWFNDEHGLALGHRRLSIIDPRPSGKQPMVDGDTGNHIVFNGEVYNYLEVREKLRQKGYSFNTDTDTEVILKAYHAYGEECLAHFNGMFAIAIWNAQRQELFLARDRLGIKPLYYTQRDGDFVFASEIKAIKPFFKHFDIHAPSIAHYMSFGYLPGEGSMLSDVKRLQPGHCAVFKNGQLNIRKYWDVTFDQSEDKGFDYYLEQSQNLLLDAINLRLRSDVPLGIFLSGGIDSSAVVGLLADKVPEPLQTFSVAYDFGQEFDETMYAKMVSEKFGTNHRQIFVQPEQFRDFVPEYVRLMDEPVTEAAAISLYFVSKLAQDNVTVVLSGEGSDEIFGGYDLYRYMNAMERIRGTFGAGLTGSLATVVNKLNLHPKLSKYAGMLAQPLEQRYRGISTYDSNIKERLYRQDYKDLLAQQTHDDAQQFIGQLFEHTKGQDALSKMLYFDTKTWLVDDLLIKADRMSMAASLELRVPFLDYRLVEFAATIPTKYKINNGQGKHILKKMMEGLLPNDIIYRKKMGFPTPLCMMFKGPMKEYSRDKLLAGNAKSHQYLQRSVIESLLNEHQSGKYDHHRVLWQLLVLEEWLQQNG